MAIRYANHPRRVHCTRILPQLRNGRTQMLDFLLHRRHIRWFDPKDLDRFILEQAQETFHTHNIELQFVSIIFSIVAVSAVACVQGKSSLFATVSCLALAVVLSYLAYNNYKERKYELRQLSFMTKVPLFKNQELIIPHLVMSLLDRVIDIEEAELVLHEHKGFVLLQIVHTPSRGASAARFIAAWEKDGVVY